MVFLLAYAVAIWIVAAIYRRRWPAFVAVLGGLPPVAILAMMCAKFLVAASASAAMSEGRPYDSEAHAMLIYILAGALMALITSVGLFIACQPRSRPDHPCGACGYDLAGNLSGVCPECGADVTLPLRQHRRARAPEPGGAAPEQSLASRMAADPTVRLRLEEAKQRAAEG